MVERRRKNPGGPAIEKEVVDEGVEEEITMDICEDWLNESHTLLRNVIARFNEGMTPLELDAVGNGIKAIELVLSDNDMMLLYQKDMADMTKQTKEKEEKAKKE